jgi:hypothetical protein
MPVKLPAPVFGTDEHPGPKSVMLADEPEAPDEVVADDEDDGMGDDEAGAAGAVLEEGDEELHAAAPTARAAAMPDTVSRRSFFTVFSLIDVCSVLGFPVWG